MEKLLSNTQTSADDIAQNYARIRENMARARAAPILPVPIRPIFIDASFLDRAFRRGFARCRG